jgi:shikimate dehydrogenase
MIDVDGQTKLVGVLGWPVAHSLSPAMHNAAFRALGMNWVYVALVVAPQRIDAALTGLVALGFRGANVTVPHKSAVMPYLHKVSEGAQAIGAVNTIVVHEDGRLEGDNTDWQGFLAPLDQAGFEPRGSHALVIGAGGSARAVAYGLARVGARVTVLNRTLARAQELVDHLAPSVTEGALVARPLEHGPLVEEADQAQLLVHTTPVGMWPDDDQCLWPEGLPFPSHLLTCDLVYRPRETRLLRKARQAGARVVDGLGMLVHQGALAFQAWTGQPAPVEIMWAACEQALEVK